MSHQNPQFQMSLRDYATKRARILMGCYRKSDAADPEVYATAVIATLVRWPMDIITSVTEPTTGLPSKLNWLPTVAEIADACRKAYEPVARQLEVDKARKQLPPPVDRSRRPTMEELKAKYGPNWGLGAGQPQRKTFATMTPADAQAILDRYAADAQCNTEQEMAE